MAEVLAVITGGITIGQLAASITCNLIKLKSYWDQVQDAPGDIRQLLVEIDSLNLILRQIEEDETQAGSSGLSLGVCFQHSLSLCKRGTEELSVLASEMALKIDGKKGWREEVGALKVALKSKDLKRGKQRMKNAIRLLNMACQCHTRQVSVDVA